MAVSSSDGENQSIQRKPHARCKSLINLITYYCIEYTLPWAGFELITLVVNGTDTIGIVNQNTIRSRPRWPRIMIWRWDLAHLIPKKMNHIGDARISVLASSAVDRGFDPRSGQKTTYWPHQVTTSLYWQSNHIDDVRISVLASSVVDRGFDPRSGQTKNDKIGTCCFAAKHAALRSKSNDWLARNQNNVSKWGVLLFQWASTVKIQLNVLVSNKADLIIITLTINLFSPWYSRIIAELT